MESSITAKQVQEETSPYREVDLYLDNTCGYYGEKMNSFERDLPRVNIWSKIDVLTAVSFEYAEI